jgi:hypothetical protein
VREVYARGPTWLAVSSIVVSTAVCTAPNPRYAGIIRQPEADAAAAERPGSAGDADPDIDEKEDAPPAPADAGADAPAGEDGSGVDARAGDAPGLDPDLPGDAADSVPTSGLVAHWPLDEGQGVAAADLSGNQNQGTLVNGPTWVTPAAPTTRSNPMALRLDGSDDYVNLMVRTVPRAEARKTIGVWFRNAAQAPRLRNLVAFFNEAEDTGIHLGFDGAKVAVWRFGDFDPIAISAQEPDAAWHHLAYSWDGTTHLLYLDGAQVATSTATVRAGAVQTARFGTWELPEEVFGGDIDEVRVYDRALSAPEIAALAGRL